MEAINRRAHVVKPLGDKIELSDAVEVRINGHPPPGHQQPDEHTAIVTGDAKTLRRAAEALAAQDAGTPLESLELPQGEWIIRPQLSAARPQNHQQAAPGDASKPPNKHYTANDAGRAERFVDRFQKDIRFVPEREIWLTWDEGRWRIDQDGALERLALKLSREMLNEAGRIPGVDTEAGKKRLAAAGEALAFGDRRHISDFLALAKVDQRILLPVSQLDNDPWLVGAKNAVIELKTNTIREYSRHDYITRTLGCEVDPQSTCPRWEQFMEEVFPDSELRHYVHKALGYTLTGNTEEECFFFCHGTGRNGKSKTITTAEHVFGGLWARAGKGIIAASSWRDYPIRELADIVGARFIIASETKEGEQLNEDVIKDLTGNDSLRAEHKYEKAFTFRAVGKLWICGNHKPKIGGTDDGIWERVRLIPFTEKFEGDRADPKLGEKLTEEAPGILNWMVKGCLLWRKEGLTPPEIVRSAEGCPKRFRCSAHQGRPICTRPTL